MRDMKDMSAAGVARAVEDNGAEFLLALGRAGGGRERDDAEIAWVIGGSPIAYHNCVVRAALEPERADTAITESQDLMRTSGGKGSWYSESVRLVRRAAGRSGHRGDLQSTAQPSACSAHAAGGKSGQARAMRETGCAECQ